MIFVRVHQQIDNSKKNETLKQEVFSRDTKKAGSNRI